tara:strand:+ start:292 stop:555 length:264 start_codon:yes stop_codon:yes gene_type:complete
MAGASSARRRRVARPEARVETAVEEGALAHERRACRLHLAAQLRQRTLVGLRLDARHVAARRHAAPHHGLPRYAALLLALLLLQLNQ